MDKLKEFVKRRLLGKGKAKSEFTAVNKTFTYNGKKFIVLEDADNSCEGCIYDDDIYGCCRPEDFNQKCGKLSRADKKSVIFKRYLPATKDDNL